MKDSASKKIIGCIGAGNMGSAILNGLSEYDDQYSLICFDKQKDQLKLITSKKINFASSLKNLVEDSDVIILALKPHLIESVLKEIKPLLSEYKLLISIAAGVNLKKMCKIVDKKCATIRVMPNTPALVNAGVFAICFEDKILNKYEKEFVIGIFDKLGTVIEMEENHFVSFTALIGAGPAYIFHFMNALVQAGVTMGFARAQSLEMVTALCSGSIKMLQKSDKCLLELRDNVCSPAGVTIEAINYMDKKAIQGNIVKAILKAQKKGFKLEKDDDD